MHLLLELLFCWRNFTSAKVVQLSLKLLFCWRNFTSAKVVQLSLKLLVVLIIRPCSGADRRPAFRPPPRSREAKPNWRERKEINGQGRARAGVRRSRTAASAIDAALPPGSRPVITCPCSGADRRPARSGPRPRRRKAQPNWRERKEINGQGRARAGVRRSRTAASAIDAALPPGSRPVITCPCKGADRRPAFRPPPRSREAKPNWRERNRCSGADRRPACHHMPVQRRRPAPGLSAAPAEP